MTRRRGAEVVAVVAVLAVAAWFRLHRLDGVPPGLFPDVAVNGTDAIETLRTGDWRVWYSDNNGREGLMINLIALSFDAFGTSLRSLKLVAAVVGIATVSATYLLGRTWFGRRAAWLSALFLATSFWHVVFSRIGFRAILVPLATCLALGALHRAVVTGRIMWWAAAGIAVGGAQHTYTSARLVPLMAVVVLVAVRRSLRPSAVGLVVFVVAAVAAAAPLVAYLAAHPDEGRDRAAQVSVFNDDLNDGNLPATFASGVLKSVGKYHVAGDENWLFNDAGRPQLSLLVGLLAVAGGVVVVRERRARPAVAAAAGAWLVLAHVPEVLTADGLPHSLRGIGVLPLPMLLAGVAADRVLRRPERAARLALVVGVVASVAWDHHSYFARWSEEPEVADAYDIELTDLAHHLDALPPEVHRYVIVNPVGGPGIEVDGLPIQAQPVLFIAHGVVITWVDPADIATTTWEEPAVVGMLGQDESIAADVVDSTGGALRRVGEGERRYLVVEVNR